MNEIPRHLDIIEIIKDEGQVSVQELSKRFQVTEQTIRKDLKRLELQHNLIRFHGGARLPSGVQNMEYESRRLIAAKEKRAIARVVAKLIPDNASLFLNIGSTTEAVGNALRGHKGLMVITDNVNVANNLRIYEEIQVFIAGGYVRGNDGAIVGEVAVDFINQFKMDYAIIGVSAIEPDGYLLDYDFREVKVVQAIMTNARHIILAADSTKFSRSASVKIGHLSQMHTFVTDVCDSPKIKKICEESGVNLITVQEDPAENED